MKKVNAVNLTLLDGSLERVWRESYRVPLICFSDGGCIWAMVARAVSWGPLNKYEIIKIKRLLLLLLRRELLLASRFRCSESGTCSY